MSSRNEPPASFPVRPAHLVMALLALLVFAACGTAVDESRPASAPGALVGLEVSDLQVRSELDAFGDRDGPSADGGGAFLANNELLEQAAPRSQVRNAGDDALIVRTASLELEVDDVAASLLDARAAMAALGGYVAGSDEYDQGDRRWASVTYRIPVERFDDAIAALRELSVRVNRESTQSQEVTATVVDLDARISNLEASEAALVQIMDRSGRIEDVLAVQLRLEDVRGQIERLEAQRNSLSDQAALSTLAVTWFTPVAAVTVAQEGWNLGTEVDAALAQTVEALQGVASLSVWAAVVALPLLGIPLLVLLILVLALRRRLHRGDGPAGSAPAAAPSE